MGNLDEIQSVKEVLTEASRLNEWLKKICETLGFEASNKTLNDSEWQEIMTGNMTCVKSESKVQ